MQILFKSLRFLSTSYIHFKTIISLYLFVYNYNLYIFLFVFNLRYFNNYHISCIFIGIFCLFYLFCNQFFIFAFRKVERTIIACKFYQFVHMQNCSKSPGMKIFYKSCVYIQIQMY